MNERIKLLAEQAEGTKKHVPSVWQFYDHELEKFAELIVRGCIVDFYRNYLDTTSDEDITEQVDRYVKEHFGVEE